MRSELIHDRSAVRISSVVLGAFNTPQFDWARNHLPERPRPVGTVYQPEIAALAVVRAALRPRREIYVGYPALQAVLGNMFVPQFLDRLLAWKAWRSQLSGEPATVDQPDNLYHPVQADHGAHGRFDAQARRTSLQYQLGVNPRVLAFAAAAALALLVGVRGRRG